MIFNRWLTIIAIAIIILITLAESKRNIRRHVRRHKGTQHGTQPPRPKRLKPSSGHQAGKFQSGWNRLDLNDMKTKTCPCYKANFVSDGKVLSFRVSSPNIYPTLQNRLRESFNNFRLVCLILLLLYLVENRKFATNR